jgi:hypothetical protein
MGCVHTRGEKIGCWARPVFHVCLVAAASAVVLCLN